MIPNSIFLLHNFPHLSLNIPLYIHNFHKIIAIFLIKFYPHYKLYNLKILLLYIMHNFYHIINNSNIHFHFNYHNFKHIISILNHNFITMNSKNTNIILLLFINYYYFLIFLSRRSLFQNIYHLLELNEYIKIS
jgi:hypothetical protein